MFVVYDKKEQKILHKKPCLGETYKKDPKFGIGLSFDDVFVIDRMIPISKDIVLIRETQRFFRERCIMYLYNARLDEVIYNLPPYKMNYRCDIFYRLSNGNIVLRFDLHYLEIWDFSLLQCNTKIFALEVSYVKELENRCLALLSEGGVQIMNLKF